MRLRPILLALGCIACVLGCGLEEVFGSPKMGNVVLTYTGPTTLTVGQRVPVSVAVSVDGASVPNPRLSVAPSSPDTIITLSPNGDTLVAYKRGFDTLTIRFVTSIITDSFPTIRQPMRVNP